MSILFHKMSVSIQVFFLYIVLTQVTPSHQQGQCFPGMNSDDGYALTGKTFKTLPAKSFPDCLYACGDNSSCMSINFHTNKEECELNSQTKETRPQLHKERKNSIYMTNVFGRLPEPLTGMQSKPAKSCLQILNDGESVGTGPHYWIDPSNTGSPIKVYCDMTTDGGGWTIVRRINLTSSTFPPVDGTVVHYYKALTSYQIASPVLLIKGAHMKAIRSNMGFNQIHFYCRKNTVGRVVSIVTKNNTAAGNQVLRFFADDAWALNNYPDACGSFDRLPDDDSMLSQTCDKWGRSRSGVWRVGKWGYYDGYGPNRLALLPITSEKRINEFGKYGPLDTKMYCDDGRFAPTNNNAGDIWQISVR